MPSAPKKKLPPPVAVAFKTRDGVQLSATFYPTPLEKDAQKDAVPVILLHSFKGSRAEFNDLAVALQEAGCAVLAPDLRGHGQSTRRTTSEGNDVEIEQALMIRQDFDAMAHSDVDTSGDVEACKKFLMDKNNAGQLNIDKLVLIGAEMGAAVAINWARRDWSWEPLASGKQGKDVKALVLLSPEWSFRGLTIGTAVADRDFASQVSWMILVGQQDPKIYPDAKRLYSALEKTPLPTTAEAPGKPAIEFHQFATSLEGTKLLAKNFNTTAEILMFIEKQVAKTAHPWMNRKSPLQ
ncbi:MAG TPA: alpha/beta fold hydrolase [Pirellulales bacterium]|nr:alpha/beta fold hydrolase [Pirellulales bacterium]